MQHAHRPITRRTLFTDVITNQGNSNKGGIPFITTVGVLITGFGITFLTINERRDVRQHCFLETGEKICRVLDTSNAHVIKDTLTSKAPIDNQLVHIYGHLHASPSPPKDIILGVSSPKGLRISRKVEMYQWVEKKEVKSTTSINANGNKTKDETVQYQYKREWCQKPQICHHSNNHKNPAFPDELQEGVGLGFHFINAANLQIGNAKTVLCPKMVSLVQDFIPLSLTDSNSVCIENPNKFKQIGPNGLQVIDNQPNILYSNGGTPEQPKLGDIRVTYEHVMEGEYTLVGKWNAATGSSENKQTKGVGGKIDIFEDHLEKHELANQGEIIVGDEAKKLATQVGYNTFIIPSIIIEWVEKALLDIAPICIALAAKGNHSLKASFDMMEKNDAKTTTGFRYFGCALCIIGSVLASTPLMVIVPVGVGQFGAIGIGALISRQTITTARTQIGASAIDANDETISILDSVINMTGMGKDNDNDNDNDKDKDKDKDDIDQQQKGTSSSSLSFCVSCGKKLPGSDHEVRFCPLCGNKQ